LLSLYIDKDWPSSNGQASLPWAISAGKKGEALTGAALDGEKIPSARKVEVIVPAGMSYLTSVEAPRRNRRLMMKSLRFAVEDEVVDDPENLHVAPAGPIQSDGRLPVAVIDRGWIVKTLDLLAKRGIFPDAVRVETLLPPVEADSISVVWNGAEGFMRTDEYSGGALDTGDSSTPPVALELAMDNASASGKHIGKIDIYLQEDATAPDVKAWSQALDAPVRVMGHWDWRKASPVARERGVNLLQGDIVPMRRTMRVMRQGRLTLALIAAIALVHSGFLLADWFSLKREANRLQTQMRDSFKTAFPKARAVVDPPLQMRRNLADLRWRAGGRDENDLIPMLSAAAPALKNNARLGGLSYDKGTLNLDLVAQTDNEVVSERDDLSRLGFDVRSAPPQRRFYGTQTRFTITRKNIR